MESILMLIGEWISADPPTAIATMAMAMAMATATNQEVVVAAVMMVVQAVPTTRPFRQATAVLIEQNANVSTKLTASA